MAKILPVRSKEVASAPAESQADAAYRILRSRVTTWQLRPGARVHLRNILANENLSRTPAREAFLRLEKDGLVEVMPRSGYRIKPLTRESTVNFFAVWKVIAPLIFRLASERMTEDQLVALREMISPLNNSSLTPLQHCEVRSTLMRTLTECIGNEYLTRINEQLTAEMERLFFMFFSRHENAQWFDSADRIVEFLRTSDGAAIERRVQWFVGVAETAILENFQ